MRHILALMALSSIACAPGEIERHTVTSPFSMNCTLLACTKLACDPVVNGKQNCKEEPTNDCNTCIPNASPPPVTTCVPAKEAQQ